MEIVVVEGVVVWVGERREVGIANPSADLVEERLWATYARDGDGTIGLEVGIGEGLAVGREEVAIGYVAIQKLPREQWPPKAMILQWVAIAQQIRQRNLELSEECNEVVTILKHDGIDSVVMKGQSNLENYPEELREYRNPGDIDLWTKQTNDCGIPMAVKQGESVEYEYYKGVRGIRLIKILS